MEIVATILRFVRREVTLSARLFIVHNPDRWNAVWLKLLETIQKNYSVPWTCFSLSCKSRRWTIEFFAEKESKCCFQALKNHSKNISAAGLRVFVA